MGPRPSRTAGVLPPRGDDGNSRNHEQAVDNVGHVVAIGFGVSAMLSLVASAVDPSAPVRTRWIILTNVAMLVTAIGVYFASGTVLTGSIGVLIALALFATGAEARRTFRRTGRKAP